MVVPVPVMYTITGDRQRISKEAESQREVETDVKN